jgi:hypothetical protein
MELAGIYQALALRPDLLEDDWSLRYFEDQRIVFTPPTVAPLINNTLATQEVPFEKDDEWFKWRGRHKLAFVREDEAGRFEPGPSLNGGEIPKVGAEGSTGRISSIYPYS